MTDRPFFLHLMLRLLRVICKPDLLEDLEGDFTELYFLKRKQHSKHKTNLVLATEFLKILRPGIIRIPRKVNGIRNSLFYWNVKLSMRSLTKTPWISGINIAGLAIAFISFFLISIYVNHEFSYDKYNTAYDRIYRVLHHYDYQVSEQSTTKNFNLQNFQVWGNAPVGPALEQSFPEIEFVGQFTGQHSYLFSIENAKYQESKVHFATGDLLNIFSWPLLQGNVKDLLKEPYTLVLTEEIAKKFFGGKEALGKSILVDNKTPYRVTGVLENIPENSHFTFDILLSMSSLRSEHPKIFESWNYVDFYTYFTLAPGKKISSIEDRISELNIPMIENVSYTFDFEPLSNAYLHSEAKRQPGTNGHLRKLIVFLTAGILILFVAFINFINIRIAQTAQRTDQLKLRRYLGAQRRDLINHFITDTVVSTTLAISLAALLISLSWPYFQGLVEIDFAITDIFNSVNAILCIGLILILTLISGALPALRLFSANQSNVKSIRNTSLTSKLLLLFQFTISTILISSTGILSDQLAYLITKDPGYESDQMLVLDFADDEEVQQNIENIKREFLHDPAVKSICAARTIPGGFFPKADTYVESRTGEIQVAAPDLFQVDHDFIDHFNLEIISGRDYDIDRMKDLSESLIINESAARLFGYDDATEVIGKRFEQWGKKGEIVGVVKDFSYQSYHHEINPMTISLGPPSSYSYLVLQLETKDLQSTLTRARHLWERLIPARPFLFKFLDHEVQESYASEVQVKAVIKAFATITVILAVLGLLGLCLILLVSQQREIAIRKVLGARIIALIIQFSKKYITLILLGIFISIPITHLLLEKWLNAYAYRITIQWTSYLWAASIIMILTIFTISSLVSKYALIKPAEIFRKETR